MDGEEGRNTTGHNSRQAALDAAQLVHTHHLGADADRVVPRDLRVQPVVKVHLVPLRRHFEMAAAPSWDL